MAADDDNDSEDAPRAEDDTDASVTSQDAPGGGGDDEGAATHPGDPSVPAAARRRSLGPTLLLLGSGAWALTAVMRCAGPPASETVAIAPDAAEPAIERAEPPTDDEEVEVAPEPPAPDPAAAAAAAEDDAEDDAEALREEDTPPPGWLDGLELPDVVRYEIRRGGSMKNVANLFKIYHHEITALNPGVDLEAELAPGTKLVVYEKKDGARSESIGFPSSGSLEGAVPMLAGRGRELKAIPWKSWGTAHTVATLDRILDQWAERGSGVQPILVGNLSAREGGRLEPHSTHQSGRDVDLGYLQKLPKGEELNWREMTAANLDAAETWKLLQLLRESKKVEVVFIDRGIQKLLYDWALANGSPSKGALRRWMEYPRPAPVSGAFIQHVNGHTDHLHVRFACTADEPRCKSR